MPSEPTPSARLREAAALLREAAAQATVGPWALGKKQTVIAPVPGRNWGLKVASDVDDVDARWIALASPAIAEPLAALLDEAARGAEQLWNALVPGTVALADGLIPWTEATRLAAVERTCALPLALADQIRTSAPAAHNQGMPR